MLASPRRRRRLGFLSALLLAGGAIAAAVVLMPEDNGDSLPTHRGGKATVVAPPPKAVKLHKVDAQEARDIAAKFVATAVLRRHVEDSWDITAPEMRAGLTRDAWNTGEIPVVPFPAKDLDHVGWKLDYSIEDHIGLQVAMLPVQNSRTKALTFEMELVRSGPAANRRWLVDYWAPLGPGVDTPAARIKQQVEGNIKPNTLGGRWLLVPVIALLGTLLAIPVALTVRGRLRHRRAERAYRAGLL
jgi:hypothetical protein